MDLGIVIGMVACTVTLVGVVIAMMFWARTEANEIRKDQKEDRKDLLQMQKNLECAIVNLNRSMENSIQSMERNIHTIQMEMKDFHHQLIEIKKTRK